MSRKPRILLAARKIAMKPFFDALGAEASFVETETLEEAVSALQSDPDIDAVCCTLYFDESRMFDLVRWVRSNRQQLRVVCARALPKDLHHISLQAVHIASTSLGATFVDFPELVRKLGAPAAAAALRSAILDPAI